MDNTKTAPDQDNFETEEEYFKACREHRKAMNTKTEEDNILEFWYVNTYIQNLESGDGVEVLDKNDFIESMKSYSDKNNAPLKKRIEELERVLSVVQGSLKTHGPYPSTVKLIDDLLNPSTNGK